MTVCAHVCVNVCLYVCVCAPSVCDTVICESLAEFQFLPLRLSFTLQHRTFHQRPSQYSKVPAISARSQHGFWSENDTDALMGEPLSQNSHFVPLLKRYHDSWQRWALLMKELRLV